ncbi:hypothetical protein FHG87_018871 [Trinorchestia longiramus]|nr:hypothetical protein FHG87_018871 [Trinorchestia longiramus]
MATVQDPNLAADDLDVPQISCVDGSLVDDIFTNTNEDERKNRVIISPKNTDCLKINEEFLTRLPGGCRTYYSTDEEAKTSFGNGVTSTGLKPPLIFIEASVKINQHIYLKTLKDEVVPWVRKVTENKRITVQQDGATSHTAILVQDWCKDNFKSFWPKELWPPSSPDLNSMDFWIWSILEQKFCAVSHSSVEVLKQKLTKSWAEIDAVTVHATCDQVILRLRQVIKEKEGYVE